MAGNRTEVIRWSVNITTDSELFQTPLPATTNKNGKKRSAMATLYVRTRLLVHAMNGHA